LSPGCQLLHHLSGCHIPGGRHSKDTQQRRC